MKKFLPTTLVITSCALGLGLAAGSFAIASYSPDAAIEDEFINSDHGFSMTDLPAPVVGDELFFAQNTGSACMSADQVKNIFLTEQAEFGGQTLEIVDSRDQAFADAWRDAAGVEKIEVTGVVGHMFRDNNDGEWTVDVVEFDRTGCAMSRTLLPETRWSSLIEASA